MRLIFLSQIIFVIGVSGVWAQAVSGDVDPQRVELPADYLELRETFDRNEAATRRRVNRTIAEYVEGNAQRLDRAQLNLILRDLRPALWQWDLRNTVIRHWEEAHDQEKARIPWPLKSAPFIVGTAFAVPYFLYDWSNAFGVGTAIWADPLASTAVTTGLVAAAWQGTQAGFRGGLVQTPRGVMGRMWAAGWQSSAVAGTAFVCVTALQQMGVF